MASEFTVAVRGYREFLRATKRALPDSRREVRHAFQEVGEVVRLRASELMQPISPRSAAGYKVRIRQRGIAVEQSLRKTTGNRPDYGALQMRKALLPARHDTYAATEAAFEHALDRIIEHFDQ